MAVDSSRHGVDVLLARSFSVTVRRLQLVAQGSQRGGVGILSRLHGFLQHIRFTRGGLQLGLKLSDGSSMRFCRSGASLRLLFKLLCLHNNGEETRSQTKQSRCTQPAPQGARTACAAASVAALRTASSCCCNWRCCSARLATSAAWASWSCCCAAEPSPAAAVAASSFA